jgi:hypothetical protein
LDEEGTIYVGTWGMKFYAVYPNGTIKWQYDAPGRIWFGSSAVLSNDGILYFGTTWMDGGAGAFIALNLDGIEQFRNDYGLFETSPAIGEDGTLYVVSSHEELINQGLYNIADDFGYLRAFGPGEVKKIEITNPKTGRFYFFGYDLGPTLSGKLRVINDVLIDIKAYSAEEIESVIFSVGPWLAEGMCFEYEYSDTNLPFSWKMDVSFGKHPWDIINWPWDWTRLRVIGRYKGGCEWKVYIDKFWYLQIGKNK